MLANKTIFFIDLDISVPFMSVCLTGYDDPNFSYRVASSGGPERDWEYKFPVTSKTEIWGPPFRQCDVL